MQQELGDGSDIKREDKKQRPPNPSDESSEVEGVEGGLDDNGEGEEEEEEGECGFCLFMKGGGCKDTFIGWEKCVEEAEKNKEDVVEKCFEVTNLLKKCMDAHADYYEPIFRAEKAMEEEAAMELDQEAASDTAAPAEAMAKEAK